jgi:hypothetical protein
MNLIITTNARVWAAIACVRVYGRTAQTLGELYDALNARRNQRAMWSPSSALVQTMHRIGTEQVRAYGQVEFGSGELFESALACLFKK